MMERYPPISNKVVVERKEDAVISMMTESTTSLLERVNMETLFVPVTTRALHQYERIHFIKELRPALAITTNGGTILENGQPNEAWARLLRQRIEDTAIPDADMLKRFEAMQDDQWLLESFYVDDLFYVYHVDLQIFQQETLALLIAEFDKLGWHVLLQGKKLYFLPKVLTKEAAIAYMKENCRYNVHVAAGDSTMDYGMLAMADYGYTPLHGDMKDKQPAKLLNTHYSQLNGSDFTEELLHDVLRLVAEQGVHNR